MGVGVAAIKVFVGVIISVGCKCPGVAVADSVAVDVAGLPTLVQLARKVTINII